MVTAIVTIVVFLVMITLHEFGHFASAKLLGVKVLEFSVGMGPHLIKHQGKKTLYALRLLPIGGYCRLEGEDGESDDPEAFSNQKLWKRFVIVASGAVINLLLGFVLFAVVVKMLSPVATNVIEKIDSRSYLAESGVAEGDKIVEVNGHKIGIYNDIALYMGELDENTKNAEIVVRRGGKKLKYNFVPSMSETTVKYGETSAEISDTVNGITEISTVEYGATEIPGELVGKTYSDKRYIIGFTAKREEITALNIIPEAWKYTVYVIKSIFVAIKDMIFGKTGLSSLSGPVGVATVISEAVNSGRNSLLNILFIVAILTVNLGIFNLLPLPALDGGRLFFMIIELIRRKPVPPEKEGMVHTIGLVLLLILAAAVCYSDIMKLIVR
ncbi:MAG: site-2 protease family protein [Clostridia bacterium]|nr:site-2 protease family protein [Clostridia bacterium]